MADPRDPGDPTDRLSELLRDAVADVEPRPALDRIRARTRTKEHSMATPRPWFLVAAGAVAATVVTVTVVTLVGDDPPGGTAAPVGPVATSTDPSPEDEEASPGPSDPSEEPTEQAPEPPPDRPSVGATPDTTRSPDPEPAVRTAALPVYYVSDTPAGPRLVREFHPDAGAATGRVVRALDRAVSSQPRDPDYRSDWPAGTSVDTVGLRGPASAPETITVVVDNPGVDLRSRPAGTTAAEARLAVQQLVHTAQAVVQHRSPVLFTSPDGRPLDTLLGVPAARPVTAGDPLAVQAPVWVITPQHGDTVGRRFTVEGRGAFFEATASWQLLRGATVVEEGFATAQECCTLSPFRFTVGGVAPGDYVLRVYAADQSGGEGVEHEDTKAITVR